MAAPLDPLIGAFSIVNALRPLEPGGGTGRVLLAFSPTDCSEYQEIITLRWVGSAPGHQLCVKLTVGQAWPRAGPVGVQVCHAARDSCECSQYNVMGHIAVGLQKSTQNKRIASHGSSKRVIAAFAQSELGAQLIAAPPSPTGPPKAACVCA